jgi:hypothetical protein
MSAEQIRDLNDAFRRTLIDGKVVMTSGVAALPAKTQTKIQAGVQTFAAFTPDNDPHGEHDFGSLEIVDNFKLFWKMDYYDAAMEFGSDDPADPAKTTRVPTIMLASEY